MSEDEIELYSIALDEMVVLSADDAGILEDVTTALEEKYSGKASSIQMAAEELNEYREEFRQLGLLPLHLGVPDDCQPKRRQQRISKAARNITNSLKGLNKAEFSSQVLSALGQQDISRALQVLNGSDESEIKSFIQSEIVAVVKGCSTQSSLLSVSYSLFRSENIPFWLQRVARPWPWLLFLLSLGCFYLVLRRWPLVFPHVTDLYWSAWLIMFGATLIRTAFHEVSHALSALSVGSKELEFGVGLQYGFPFAYADISSVIRLPNAFPKIVVLLSGVLSDHVFCTICYVFAQRQLGAFSDGLLYAAALGWLLIPLQLLPPLRNDGYGIWVSLSGVDDLEEGAKNPEKSDDLGVGQKRWVNSYRNARILGMIGWPVCIGFVVWRSFCDF